MTNFDQIWPILTKFDQIMVFDQIWSNLVKFVFLFFLWKHCWSPFAKVESHQALTSWALTIVFIPKKQHWTHDDFLNSVHFSWIANMNFRFHEIEILEKCCVQNLLQTWFKCFQAFIWWAKSFTWPYCTYIFLFILEFICMKYFHCCSNLWTYQKRYTNKKKKHYT